MAYKSLLTVATAPDHVDTCRRCRRQPSPTGWMRISMRLRWGSTGLRSGIPMSGPVR